jgi:hypothetical protein
LVDRLANPAISTKGESSILRVILDWESNWGIFDPAGRMAHQFSPAPIFVSTRLLRAAKEFPAPIFLLLASFFPISLSCFSISHIHIYVLRAW